MGQIADRLTEDVELPTPLYWRMCVGPDGCLCAPETSASCRIQDVVIQASGPSSSESADRWAGVCLHQTEALTDSGFSLTTIPDAA
jgi:hypothetical protein